MSSRRVFLTNTIAASTMLSASARSLVSASRSPLADDPLRPQFHLLPLRGWMNDPNGPIVWRGKVHLFYQVNPHGGAKWADISWGHAVSSDLVHWRHLPVALKPEAGYADSYGVFSGSCIADGDRCLAFYTAVELPETPEAATVHDPDKELREQQVVAVSNDPELRHWTRQKQPLLSTPPLQPTAGFRDPSVWKEGDTWYMVIGSGVRDKYGAILLFEATIPAGPQANWKYQHPLLSNAHEKDLAQYPALPGTMWECPDFFELDGHHVLLYSADGKALWLTGTLDRHSFTFKPKQHGVLDTGAYYAPKSMVGPKGERILWGWIQERRPESQYVAAGWSGVMSLPRVLRVSEDGTLRMSVASAVSTLLVGKLQTSTSRLQISRLNAKLNLRMPADGCSLSVQAGDAPLVRMRRVSKDRLEVNGKIIDAPLAGTITLYVDGSVIEMFFGDRSAHTLRAYPVLGSNSGLIVTATGATIACQSIRSISSDRLTT